MTPREHRAKALGGRKQPSPRPQGGKRPRDGEPIFYDGPITRHLAMHIWPVSGSPVWRWNVEQVLKRINQFNGRRVIGIVTGESADPPEAVKEAFAGHDCEFIVKPNSSQGEIVTAPEMFQRLIRSNRNDLLFYCHAKGVKYRVQEIDERPTIRWPEVMYRTLLDDPQAAASALTTKTFAGSFRRRHGSQNSSWHYSGTFFWLRSIYMPPSAWTQIPRRYAGVEFWPARIANWSDAACLFHDNCQNLYSRSYWRASVEPELAEWEQLRDAVSVIVPCHNYGRYLAECVESIQQQTLQPREIVVVDDSSNDDTAQVAKRLPVKYIRIEARDPHEARRAGYATTRGRYVCFVDADDKIAPEYLQSAMAALESSNATIAYSDVQHFGDSEKLRRHRPCDIRVANYIHGGSVCRRDALATVMSEGLPDARRRYSDWWLWRHALRCGGSTVRHDGLYFYRKHGHSLTDARGLVSEEHKHCRDLLGIGQ